MRIGGNTTEVPPCRKVPAVKVRPTRLRAAPAWMPMEELVRLLGSVDVLETLPPQGLRELASRSSLERLRARETMAVDPKSTRGG